MQDKAEFRLCDERPDREKASFSQSKTTRQRGPSTLRRIFENSVRILKIIWEFWAILEADANLDYI